MRCTTRYCSFVLVVATSCLFEGLQGKKLRIRDGGVSVSTGVSVGYSSSSSGSYGSGPYGSFDPPYGSSYVPRVQVNPPELVLSDSHVITDVPQRRVFNWVITNSTAAFDGYRRNVLLINNQFPGPLIEANEGDTIVISVENRINEAVAIHWHGIYQRGTQWMDGVSSVTQCPQQPGVTFVYEFPVQNQFGTFWYHAHAGNLLSDGIMGPLVVHSVRDPLVKGRDFDREIVLFMNDWYHDMSTYIADKMLSAEGYNGSFAAPSPNSALLNGIGFFNCDKYASGSACQSNYSPLEIQVYPQQRTRIRLINGGSHVLFKVSIDNHPLEVIEADSTPVRSTQMFHRLPMHNGERYSIILDTRADKFGDAFYLRAAMDTDCLAWLAPGMDTKDGNTALAIIRVTSPAQSTLNTRYRLPRPTSQDWNEAVNGPCIDLDIAKLVPRVPADLSGQVLGRVYYNTSFGTLIDPNARAPNNTLGRFFIDTTTWLARTFKPLLPRLLQGGPGYFNNSDVTAKVISQPGIWDIVINNLDNALDHPIHLHGMDSCVVAEGKGALNETTALQLQYNQINPLCRDVHVVPGGTFIVMRVRADNPGVWVLHCHIGWHLAAGFAGMLVVQPDVLRQTALPQKNADLCNAGRRTDNLDQIEPGR